MGFTFQGGEELARALRQLPDAISLKVQQDALREAAEPIRAYAAGAAPRGDVAPHLADNIVIGIPSDKSIEDFVQPDVAVIAVGPAKDFFYGLFWEYGTMKLPARPFMRPAFDTQAPTAFGIIGRALWNAIANAAGIRSRSTGVGV